MKRIIHFFKNNIGATAIEAMIVVPLWLLTIIFVSRTLIISNSRYKLAHESLSIGTVISQSRSKEEAVQSLTYYLKTNKVSGITVDNVEMKLLTNTNNLLDDWKDYPVGSTIRVKVTIDTPFDDMRFSSMEIGGQIVHFFPARFTNEFTVMLAYK